MADEATNAMQLLADGEVTFGQNDARVLGSLQRLHKAAVDTAHAVAQVQGPQS